MNLSKTEIIPPLSLFLPLQAWSQYDRGTLAYVLDDDSLFLRAARGWREIMVSWRGGYSRPFPDIHSVEVQNDQP